MDDETPLRGSALLILRDGRVVRLEEEEPFEGRVHFATYIQLLGDDVNGGQPIYGWDEHGDFVYVPAASIEYVRGITSRV